MARRKLAGVSRFQMQRMAGLRSDKSHEGELGPPIAITKYVNGVEHTQELSCLDGEVIRGEVAGDTDHAEAWLKVCFSWPSMYSG